MPSWWIYPVLLSFLISLVLCDAGRALGRKWGYIDEPRVSRKKQKGGVSTLGGVAIFIAVSISLIGVLLFSDALTMGTMINFHFVGYLLGGLVLVVGGLVDDKFSLRARYSILFPLAAALIAASFGIGVSKITNPLGGFFEVGELISFAVTFAWLLGMTYVTKLLDGLDGLASGVSSIAGLMMGFLALSVAFYQPDAALLSFLIVAAFLGFLVWNWSPASIYHGEAGSTFVGYSIGILAVIGGGKFATALLVVAIPLFDILFVLWDRYRCGVPLFAGDRRHLHFRLRDLGLSVRSIVLIYYAVALIFGLSSLIFESWQKLIVLGLLFIGMLAAIYYIQKCQKKN
ncbi:undecaprenyl/decaprenyl-phosphate alpha-N-acetylglucosaminyl 1-phosphate transferase [Candidatus Uhrbacteria bacterium]|jgi:UDP-GlcNAc:undecaprenyl-phosphate/decaprenyl-phosphate GlcNAc-1-phosphate transferase|nr:undecaprenyl/decaprenyl-phosphate alpha-N-acetylglucosaminyl 1-phosphate transferase [Candidatus Uhrbacteria bacterium]MBT7717649.1 undecaprenyl/decaprenyl-phosphate alpha-N-acetylglucosaminyl 1-phosphate transferase [Candidatus Uhrbacteria bacterium]